MPSGSMIEMRPLSGSFNEICHSLGRVYSGSRAPLSSPDARLSGVQVDVAPALLELLQANGALVLVLGRLPLARSTTGFLLLPSGLPLGLLPGPGGLSVLHPAGELVLSRHLPLELAILPLHDALLSRSKNSLSVAYGHLSRRDGHLPGRAGGMSRQRDAVRSSLITA
jgi:hypothetical protein